MELENKYIKIKIGEKTYKENYKTTISEVLKKHFTEDEIANIYAVRVNNQVRSLTDKLYLDSELIPIDYYDADGYKIYMRTVKLLLSIALKRLYKDLKVELCNTIDSNSYFICHDMEFTDNMAQKLCHEMNKIKEQDLPITKRTVSFEEAYAIFKAQGEKEKLNDMQIKIKPTVSMCFVDGIAATMYGTVAPSTKHAGLFDIKKFRKGFVLVYSNRNDKGSIDTEIKTNGVYQVFEEFNDYAEKMGIRTVSDLNQTIIDGKIAKVIKSSEEIQQTKLEEIKNNIISNKNIKFILVAGPSSSGKTTFASRIGDKLRKEGIQPITISMDNYFKERVDTPKLPNGEYDFETVDALDMELFNSHMHELLAGKTILSPEFNFYTGEKEYKENYIELKENNIIILEGIHALNPYVTKCISDELKYKIYIAPMTTLNMDEFSKVSTTDTRVLRRMVRDFRTRGHSVDSTLNMWENITRGEKAYIYPYIKEADYIFNTSFVYEVAALSVSARPLLLQVKVSNKKYSESRRLYNFLSNFLTIDDKYIPENSLLREFIG